MTGIRSKWYATRSPQIRNVPKTSLKQPTLGTIQIPTLHTGQLEVAHSPVRFHVLSCGRRWGKTLFGVVKALAVAVSNPRRYVWWVAPTYPLAEIGWDALRGLLFPLIEAGLVQVNVSRRMVLFPNGSWIQVKSATSVSGLRGRGLHYVVVDEAAFVPREAWEKQLRPALADRRGGALLISTPVGMENWFHELWVRGQDEEFPTFASWQFPTWSNPVIHPEEIEEARAQMPEDAFRQEIGAEFLESDAGVFRNLAAIFMADLGLRIAHRGHKHVIGYDVAKLRDFAAWTVIDITERTVVAFHRARGMDYPRQIQFTRDLIAKYPGVVWIDSTGVGEPVFDHLSGARINVEPFRFTSETKRKLVENGALLTERARVKVPLCNETKVLLSELKAYRYQIGVGGAVTYGAPSGFKDDAATSFLLALWGLTAPTTQLLVAPPEMEMTYFGGSATRRL